jgi:hypothetical protein
MPSDSMMSLSMLCCIPALITCHQYTIRSVAGSSHSQLCSLLAIKCELAVISSRALQLQQWCASSQVLQLLRDVLTLPINLVIL